MAHKRFELLIATMNDKLLTRLSEIPYPATVINQTVTPTTYSVGTHRIHAFAERGLSRSRNRAVTSSSAEVCLVSDDDVNFMSGIDTRILQVFDDYPDADIVTFKVSTPDGQDFKPSYQSRPFWHNKRSVMRVCSIEIAFRREAILRSNVFFDEDFGLGAKFPTGEEIIFLCDALDRGLKILYFPLTVAVHEKESSGSQLAGNSTLLKAKGAMFRRIFGRASYLISAFFALRKYRETDFGFFRFFRYMCQGNFGYKKNSFYDATNPSG